MTYLITGGGSGIGRALAHGLAKRGKQVLIVGRRMSALEETAKVYKEQIHCLMADVALEDDRQKIADWSVSQEKLDAVVHNAAIIAPICPIAEMTLADWRKHQAINVEAPLFLTQALLPQLSGGRVLMISSGAAHRAIASWSAYCTGKAALDMLWLAFKAELSERGIAFGSVMPGIVDTGMQTQIRASNSMTADDEAFFHALKNEQKLLTTETVAEFLAWLLCDVNMEQFADEQWDIYDEAHHSHWVGAGSGPSL